MNELEYTIKIFNGTTYDSYTPKVYVNNEWKPLIPYEDTSEGWKSSKLTLDIEDIPENILNEYCLTFSSPICFSLSVSDSAGEPQIGKGNNLVFKNKEILNIDENKEFRAGGGDPWDDEYINSLWDGILEYSTDKQNWIEWDGSDITAVISNDNNYKIYLRGSQISYFASSNSSFFVLSGIDITISGNIATLLDWETIAVGQLPLLSSYIFKNLFSNNDSIIDVSNLILPFTTLTPYCCAGMFSNCTSLVAPPILSAINLAEYCYSSMFSNCTSLITSPILPATTLANNCYSFMFIGCSSLITAPQLPATTLASSCYSYMFNGCTALVNPPTLPATTLANYCYSYMFWGCTSLVMPPALPAITLANNCYTYMFRECTSLTISPSLPATTLANWCYQSMFSGCTSLTTAPTTLPATNLADYCYYSMFNDCTSLITAPILPATNLVNSCYYRMFYGCTSLTTAPKLPAITLADECYLSMFQDCTSLVTLPALPATTLAIQCYMRMFLGCSLIKLSTTQTGEYLNAYRIPTSGTITSNPYLAFANMFVNTGGTVEVPTRNTTYYTSNTIIS